MKTLVVLTGPTGVGKTELSLSLAERLGSPIVNADSRQIYRELPIGTAAPTEAEQRRVRHYFVGTHSVEEDYNAGQFERDALTLLETLFATHDRVLMVGGAMLYIDAVCNGLDDIPSVPSSVREQVQTDYQAKGLEWLQQEVQRLDPSYYDEVDRQNPQRLLHALEVCLATGHPYSDYRTKTKKERPFRIIKVGLTRPREELYDRINRRVDAMLAQGLQEEAQAVYPLRECNSLQTVGYREMFRHLSGEWSLEEAVRMIKQNSRHYAKRQLTWYRQDEAMHWFDLSAQTEEEIIDEITELIQHN